MSILDEIIKHKKAEVAVRKIAHPLDMLRSTSLFNRKCFSMREALLREHSSGIIAEFKRRSPSKGFINEHASASGITTAYKNAGAAALSVLTDSHFFGGSNEDLIAARVNEIPILRKDFIIDPYQITEAKSIGADAILLIAACLEPAEVKDLAGYATEMGLEVLLEIHEESELKHICDSIGLVGINNRNLATFKVDTNLSLSLGKMIGRDKIKVAESGIQSAETVQFFREAGFKGFLVGEAFMKTDDPGETLKNFIKTVK